MCLFINERKNFIFKRLDLSWLDSLYKYPQMCVCNVNALTSVYFVYMLDIIIHGYVS